ncbi:MAG: primosomal protein N' [Chitinophagaceae bacterium]
MLSFGNQKDFQFAEVILPLNFANTLTYGVPVDMQHRIVPGMRVEVALKDNKFYAGIVLRLHNDKPEAYSIRPIRAILDPFPVVNQQQLDFWRWISSYYMASPGEVMNAALPAHLKLSNETHLEWSHRQDHDHHQWDDYTHRAIEQLILRNTITISELRQIVGSGQLSSVIHTLIENELVYVNEGLEPSYRPKKEKIVRLNDVFSDDEQLHILFEKLGKAPVQQNLLMAFLTLNRQEGFVRRDDLLQQAKAKAPQLKPLVDKGVFLIEETVIDRIQFKGGMEPQSVILSEPQQRAFREISHAFSEKNVCLLEGVTASGKTLLYVELIKEQIAAGKQVLFLLPEIGITTQLVQRLLAHFGNELGVYHSRFSHNERVEIWEKVRKAEYKIVLGTRSALWLPFRKLGLIIVDEEHDSSYKQQDMSPRFQARDAAVYLGGLYQARILLGSATPSVESIWNAQQGKYAHVLLSERYAGIALPDIEIVSAHTLNEKNAADIRLLTPELLNAIQNTLTKRKQVILFQNKRGYIPFQMCRSCGWVPQCVNCAVSLTYHKPTNKLHCHYCGLKVPVVYRCQKCGSSDMQPRTFGTQKLEEEIQTLFPKARVARMDTDTTRGKQDFERLLEQLRLHAIDILIGTQMVVKGLDFPDVTLVGIISSDSLLSFPDFRVNERGFQLMSQVAGRAGRKDGDGKVLIQAFNTNHPVLHWVKDHNLRDFVAAELNERSQFYTRLFAG